MTSPSDGGVPAVDASTRDSGAGATLDSGSAGDGDAGSQNSMIITNLENVSFAPEDGGEAGLRVTSFSMFSFDSERHAEEMFVGIENFVATTACRMKVRVRLENADGELLAQITVPVIGRLHGPALEECLDLGDEGIAAHTNLSDETSLRIDEVAHVELALAWEALDLAYFADTPQLESLDLSAVDGSTRFRGVFRIGDVPVATPSAAFFARDEQGFFRDWAISSNSNFFDAYDAWQFASTELVRSSPADVHDTLTFVRFQPAGN